MTLVVAGKNFGCYRLRGQHVLMKVLKNRLYVVVIRLSITYLIAKNNRVEFHGGTVMATVLTIQQLCNDHAMYSSFHIRLNTKRRTQSPREDLNRDRKYNSQVNFIWLFWRTDA